MAPIACAYNSTDRPVAVGAGRSIDGHSWGPVDPTDPTVAEASASGDLHVYPELEAGPGQSAAATEAIDRTEAARSALAELEGLGEKALAELGAEHGTEDVTTLALMGVKAPKSKKAKPKASKAKAAPEATEEV